MGKSGDYEGCVTPVRSRYFDIFERHRRHSPLRQERDGELTHSSRRQDFELGNILKVVSVESVNSGRPMLGRVGVHCIDQNICINEPRLSGHRCRCPAGGEHLHRQDARQAIQGRGGETGPHSQAGARQHPSPNARHQVPALVASFASCASCSGVKGASMLSRYGKPAFGQCR
jgi:hypothetical protein